MNFVLVYGCEEGIYFSFGHPVGEENHQGWLKDEGLPIAQEGLSLSEYPEVADSVEGSLNCKRRIGFYRGDYRFQLHLRVNTW